MLEVVPRGRVSTVALLGDDRGDGRLVLPVGRIASVSFRAGNPLVNGLLDVRSVEGKRYQLHFRRKSNAEFAGLHAALVEAVGS